MGNNIYLYRETNHRAKGIKKVKQVPHYIGRDMIVDGETVIREPKKWIMVRRLFESAQYIM